MRKKIIKEGNSHKVRITKEDRELYDLHEGDIIELTITKIIREEEGTKHAKTK